MLLSPVWYTCHLSWKRYLFITVTGLLHQWQAQQGPLHMFNHKQTFASYSAHLITHNLQEQLQSSYRPCHSVETALLHIQWHSMTFSVPWTVGREYSSYYLTFPLPLTLLNTILCYLIWSPESEFQVLRWDGFHHTWVTATSQSTSVGSPLIRPI